MSKKSFVPSLFLAALLVFVLAAAAHAEIAPAITKDSLISEVNGTGLDEALALFSEDASVANHLVGRTYVGTAEIEGLLDEWQRPGRAYEIVALSMDGDTVNVTLDVSDRGIVWAQQRMSAEVDNDLIQSLELQAIRLSFIPVRLN